MVLAKPNYKAVLRHGAETEYGVPTPVLIVEVDEATHPRLGMALLHRLACAIEMASLNENWTLEMGSGFSLMGAGQPHRSYIKLSLADGTIEEALRGMTVLETAAATMNAIDKWIAVEFQGAQLPVPKIQKAK